MKDHISSACQHITTRKCAIATVVVLLLALVSRAGSQREQYCRICSDHTLCRYQGPASRCGRLRGNGTTTADQNTIVAVHNELRNRVASGAESRGSPGPQPEAADMNALVWDSELAQIAQRWAEQCSFGHDSCRDVSRFSVGQNVYQSSTTGTTQGPQWRRAIQEWYDEVTSFSRSNINNYRFRSSTGHYSQVVWATTRYIGCGYAEYPDGGWISQLYVCNYGPPGNYAGESVYTTGQRCSRCTNGCHRNYTALCA